MSYQPKRKPSIANFMTLDRTRFQGPMTVDEPMDELPFDEYSFEQRKKRATLVMESREVRQSKILEQITMQKFAECIERAKAGNRRPTYSAAVGGNFPQPQTKCEESEEIVDNDGKFTIPYGPIVNETLVEEDEEENETTELFLPDLETLMSHLDALLSVAMTSTLSARDHLAALDKTLAPDILPRLSPHHAKPKKPSISTTPAQVSTISPLPHLNNVEISSSDGTNQSAVNILPSVDERMSEKEVALVQLFSRLACHKHPAKLKSPKSAKGYVLINKDLENSDSSVLISADCSTDFENKSPSLSPSSCSFQPKFRGQWDTIGKTAYIDSKPDGIKKSIAAKKLKRKNDYYKWRQLEQAAQSQRQASWTRLRDHSILDNLSQASILSVSSDEYYEEIVRFPSTSGATDTTVITSLDSFASTSQFELEHFMSEVSTVDNQLEHVPVNCRAATDSIMIAKAYVAPVAQTLTKDSIACHAKHVMTSPYSASPPASLTLDDCYSTNNKRMTSTGPHKLSFSSLSASGSPNRCSRGRRIVKPTHSPVGIKSACASNYSSPQPPPTKCPLPAQPNYMAQDLMATTDKAVARTIAIEAVANLFVQNMFAGNGIASTLS